MINVSDKTKKYLDMMENKFNRVDFYEFVKDLLNLENKDIVNGKEENATSEQYKHYIDKSQLFAKYQDSKREMIGVIIVKLKDNKTPANARTLQRNYIAHLLEYYKLDASIAAIYSDTDDTWRLSFVKKELQIEVGKRGTKIGQKISPAKRYSYLFGKDEPNHTAKEQLLELLENNNEKFSIEKIEERFSVEKVTKDFFERYKENYLKLKEMLEQNEEFISESKRCDFTSEEFTKKLLGQIVFIYFLQKKGWLGVKIVPSKMSFEEYNDIYNKQDAICKRILEKYYINFSGYKKVKTELLEHFKENESDLNTLSNIFANTKFDMAWGTGKRKFIRTLFENCKDRNKNFFDDYLEPFFYNGLNHKRDNQYFSVFNCKVPFLNGGLFEPLDNYNWETARFGINNEIFSNKDETGILDFFDRYNFTMNEEEPLEKDVAVDPEMLGKIFENLLDVKDRKSKGAFYTPREIVHYMCQESLANFLVNNVGVDYNEIKEFIQYGEMIRDIDLKKATKNDYLVGESIFQNITKIDKALENIKIADPAVGSGAFPLGMLNEIVKLRDILTSYMLIYNKLGLFDKMYPEEMITNKRNIYTMKWNTIKNCIYAVDIENSAVDITKLRLWLSIVVDQVHVPKTGPEPLPNLDCKIMQGNSLIDEYDGIKLIDKKFIDELKDRDNVKFNDGGRFKERGRFVSISGEQIQFGDGQKKVQIDDLIRLKQELYGTNNPERKKELLAKIQDVRKELLRLNFQGTKNEKEFWKIDKSHNKPYFAWRLEFIEVFIDNGGFDIVIGNPPYVQLQKNNGSLANELKVMKYETFTRMGDIYCLFYEKAIDLLKYGGNFSYITSNKWLRAGYGEKLREYLGKNCNPKILIDFGKNKIFDTATVDVNILIAEKKENELNTTACLINENYNLSIINEYIKKHSSKYIFNTKDNWIISNPIETSIKEKIEKIGVPLSDWDISINYGLKTGFNEAFVIDKETKEMLIAEDPKNEKIIKPILRGRDIKNYMYNFEENWLIFVPWHFPLHEDNSIKGASLEAENKFKNDYPVIYKYLEQYKDKLSSRNRAETCIRYEWYSLQRWGAKYYEDFEKEKIIWPCIMTSESSFMLDSEGKFYTIAPGNIITGKNLKYLIAFLNSRIYYFALRKFYMGGGIEGELKTNRLLMLPVPLPNKNKEKIINCVDKIIKDIKDYNQVDQNDKNKIDVYISDIF